MFLLFAFLSLSASKENLDYVLDFDELDNDADANITSDIEPDPDPDPKPAPTPSVPAFTVTVDGLDDTFKPETAEKYISENAGTVKEFNITIKDGVSLNLPVGTGITYDITGTTFTLSVSEAPSFLNVHDCTSITLKSDKVFPKAAFSKVKGDVEITIEELQLDIPDCTALENSKVTKSLDIFNTTTVDDTQVIIPYVTDETEVKAKAKHFIIFNNGFYIQGKAISFYKSKDTKVQPKVIKPYGFERLVTIQLSNESLTRKVNSDDDDEELPNPNIEIEDIETNGQISIIGYQNQTNKASIHLKSEGKFILVAKVPAEISLGENTEAIVSPSTLNNITGYQTQKSGTYLIGTKLGDSTITEITYVTGGIKIDDVVYSNVKIYNQNGKDDKLTLKYESGDLDCGLEFADNSAVYIDGSFSQASGKKLSVTAEKDQKINLDSADGISLDDLLDIKDSNGESIPASHFTEEGEDNSKLIMFIIIIAAVVVVVLIIVIICCCCCNKKKKDASSSSLESQSDHEEKRKQLKNRPSSRKSLTMRNYRKNRGSSSSDSDDDDSDSSSSSSSSSEKKKSKSKKHHHHH